MIEVEGRLQTVGEVFGVAPPPPPPPHAKAKVNPKHDETDLRGGTRGDARGQKEDFVWNCEAVPDGRVGAGDSVMMVGAFWLREERGGGVKV